MTDFRFPAWRQVDGTAIWVVPFSASNAVPQYGRFRDIHPDRIRPPRRAGGGAMLEDLAAPMARAMVTIHERPRHVGIFCRYRAEQTVRLEVLPRIGPDGPLQLPCRPAVPLLPCQVIAGRPMRLPAWPIGTDEVPWLARAVDVEGWYSEQAATIWDAVIQQMRPRPIRFLWDRDPWVWALRVRVCEPWRPS